VVFVLALFAGVSLSLPIESRVRYDGQQVVRAVVDTTEKLTLVEDILMLDVWGEWPNGVMDLRVTPGQILTLQRNQISFVPYIDDVQALLDASERVSKNPSPSSYEWFEEYHRYDEQIAFYRQQCSDFPTICTFVPNIGTTFEGRQMHAVRLRGNNNGARKLFWDGGIHAREWISSATVAYLFYTLVTGYGSNPDATNILNTFEVVIVPHQNPDGYEYSWTNDRLWRKNRATVPGSTCRGVDLNRNYDVYWGEGGSSTNPCSDTYMGESPASEPETRNFCTYFLSIFNSATELPVAISFHSYSQLILRPYGNTRTNAPHETEMRGLGQVMADAIRATHGLTYDSIKSIDLYVTTGTTSDWYYNVTENASYGYTIELRDTGRYGFVLPPDQIIPQGEEIWAAMVAMAHSVGTIKQ